MSMFVVFELCVAAVLLHQGHAEISCPAGTSATQLVQEQHYNLEGKTYVMSGGDSGIGQQTVDALALAGARIILLAHNVQKTEDQIQALAKKSGNSKITAVPVNLLSLASVKVAAEEVLRITDRIDGVINDAGADGAIKPMVTEDGFNSEIALEYISSYLLVQLLLPKLRATQGRVIFISSAGMDLDNTLCAYGGAGPGCYELEFLKTYVHQPDAAGMQSLFIGLYLKTMLARIIAEKEARNGVTAYSFHPGMVVTPGTIRNPVFGGKAGLESIGDECAQMVWWQCMCNDAEGRASKTCALTADQGALSAAYLAAAPEAELASINGGLIVGCGVAPGPDPDAGYLDPYPQLVSKIGQASAEAYLRGVDELSMSWITSSSSALSQTPVSIPTSSIALVAFAATCVLLIVASRRQTSEMGAYKLLASESDA